jgi:hypothetical protein
MGPVPPVPACLLHQEGFAITPELPRSKGDCRTKIKPVLLCWGTPDYGSGVLPEREPHARLLGAAPGHDHVRAREWPAVLDRQGPA